MSQPVGHAGTGRLSPLVLRTAREGSDGKTHQDVLDIHVRQSRGLQRLERFTALTVRSDGERGTSLVCAGSSPGCPS